jgi:hypothetical protein
MCCYNDNHARFFLFKESGVVKKMIDDEEDDEEEMLVEAACDCGAGVYCPLLQTQAWTRHHSQYNFLYASVLLLTMMMLVGASTDDVLLVRC